MRSLTESLPPEIRTPRLLLRRQHPHDARLIKNAVDASLDHLQSSVAWAQAAPTPITELAAHLAEAAAAFDGGKAWAFSIFDPSATRVLGGVALEPAEDALLALAGPATVEAGYWLRADATGCGYATEATAYLVDLAFTRLGARRVAICHDPANAASGGVPRRLGFRSLGLVANVVLPGRRAADGSVRAETMVWVLDASDRTSACSVLAAKTS
jgi:RimJ/RimL family protein N-acetyltransferase